MRFGQTARSVAARTFAKLIGGAAILAVGLANSFAAEIELFGPTSPDSGKQIQVRIGGEIVQGDLQKLATFLDSARFS